MVKKYLAFIILFILPCSLLFSQDSTGVAKGSFKLPIGKIHGYYFEFAKAKSDIDKSLFNFLREMGKFSSQKAWFEATEMNTLDDSGKVTLFIQTLEKGEKTSVKFGLNKENMEEDDFKKIDDRVKRVQEAFLKRLRIENVEYKIEEVQAAADHKRKIFQRLVKESGILENRKEYNDNEQERLRGRLVKLEEDKQDIEDKLQLNEELMKLANDELEQIMLRLDQLKQKLREASR